MSSLRMASTATVYRRFEREKICGRQYPWKTNSEVLIENATNEETEINNKAEVKQEEHIYETLPPRRSERTSLISQNTNESRSKIVSDMIQFSPRSNVTEPFFNDEGCCSDASSDYLQPIPVNKSRRSSSLESDSEYVRPISIIDRVAPRRHEFSLQ